MPVLPEVGSIITDFSGEAPRASASSSIYLTVDGELHIKASAFAFLPLFPPHAEPVKSNAQTDAVTTIFFAALSRFLIFFNILFLRFIVSGENNSARNLFYYNYAFIAYIVLT